MKGYLEQWAFDFLWWLRLTPPQRRAIKGVVNFTQPIEETLRFRPEATPISTDSATPGNFDRDQFCLTAIHVLTNLNRCNCAPCTYYRSLFETEYH